MRATNVWILFLWTADRNVSSPTLYPERDWTSSNWNACSWKPWPGTARWIRTNDPRGSCHIKHPWIIQILIQFQNDIFISQSRVEITPNSHICEELPYLNWELSKNKFEFPIVNKEKVFTQKTAMSIIVYKTIHFGMTQCGHPADSTFLMRCLTT